MEKLNKNTNIIDLVKIIMAVFVVAIHTNPLEHCGIELVKSISQAVFELAVPFFFMSTGYLISMKLESNDNVDYIKNQFIKLFKMYVMWVLIYIPLNIFQLVNYSDSENPGQNLINLATNFVFVGEQGLAVHLWYLLSGAYGLLVIYILYNLKNKMFASLAVAITFFVMAFGVYGLISVNINAYPISLFKEIISHTIINGRIFYGGIFISLGMLSSKIKIKKIFLIVILIASVLCNSLFDNSGISLIFVITGAASFFKLMEDVKLKDSKIYVKLRKISSYIYFVHIYVMVAFYMLAYGEKHLGIITFIVTLILSVLISVIILVVKDKMSKSNKRISKIKSI